MKKSIIILAFMLFGAIAVCAQNNQPENGFLPQSVDKFNASENTAVRRNSRQSKSSSDYKPFEIFVGYSLGSARFKEYNRDSRLQSIPRLDRAFSTRDKFKRGFEASGVYNFSRFAGVKADFSLNFNERKATVNNRNVSVKERLTNYLLGIQLKDNSNGKNPFRPFAHALIGFNNSKSSLKDCSAFGTVCPNSLNRSRYGLAGAIGGGVDIKISNSVTWRAIQADYVFGKITEGVRFSTGIVF